jgi:hypothetical protein
MTSAGRSQHQRAHFPRDCARYIALNDMACGGGIQFFNIKRYIPRALNLRCALAMK